mgnify:CR=1 FL=1
MIVWIDTETTGLDPKKDALLEIAVVITDDELNIEHHITTLIAPKRRKLRRMDDFVSRMHTESGLLNDLDTFPVFSIEEAEKHILAFLDLHGAGDRLLLAGNSVHFDRGFLDVHMPKLSARFGHQHLDVTSVSHCVRRWNKKVYDDLKAASGKVAHRAIDDILSSINQLRWYRENAMISESESAE